MTSRAGVPAFVPPGESVALRSERRVDVDYTLAAQLDARLRVADCRSAQGPSLSLRAALTLPVLSARVIFRHRTPRHDPFTKESTREVTVVPPEARVERVDGRLRSIPSGSLLTLRVLDHERRPLAHEHVVGDCLDGSYEIGLPLLLEATASAWVVPRGWTEQQGAAIKLSGALTMRRGVSLQVGTLPRRPRDWDSGLRSIAMELLRPGQTPHYHEKSFDAELPLNSWALIGFYDQGGRPIGQQHPIGRFVIV